MLPQRVAYLDLDSNRVDIEDIPEDITRKFLGGRGINMYLLYRYASPQTVPLSPQNPLIIGPGMLTGLKGISASRSNISGKSPETGLLGDANMGGYFGAFMKRTGIDFLVVTGAAEAPAYIYMDKIGISIKDAADLWGKSTIETNEILQERHSSSSQAMSIGVVGENLVRFAGIINRRKNAAAGLHRLFVPEAGTEGLRQGDLLGGVGLRHQGDQHHARRHRYRPHRRAPGDIGGEVAPHED